MLGSTGIAVAQGTGSAGNSGTAEGRNTPGQSDARPAPGEQKSVGARVVIAPEQQTAIKQYVVQEKIRPHKLSSRVTVGATLPADVELAPVPETWGTSFRSYRYVYTGDDVVLVDPSSRRVVE